jgi:hypothetical protein
MANQREKTKTKLCHAKVFSFPLHEADEIWPNFPGTQIKK